MKSHHTIGLLAAAVFSAPLLAQIASVPPTVLPPTFTYQQTFTTGMIGFTTNQTARLNVLNLNAVPATSSATQTANCTVELQFYDEKNNLQKQSVVPNFAPGMSTSLDLLRSAVTSPATALRAEIRGVVVVNPSPSPVASPAAVGPCGVLTTLEIFDSTTGSTVAVTSDTRALGGYLVPVISTTPFR